MIVPEKIHAPPTQEIENNPLTLSSLFGWGKFSFWVGCGSFLEQSIVEILKCYLILYKIIIIKLLSGHVYSRDTVSATVCTVELLSVQALFLCH